MQTSLFNTTNKNTIEPNDFKPGLTIDERIHKYHTRLNGNKAVCDCQHHMHYPGEDCIHIKELRLRNLRAIDETIMSHISEKRDQRDRENQGLEGAIRLQEHYHMEDMRSLTEDVLRLAREYGVVCSDDLHRVTNEAYKDNPIIGTVFAVLVRGGVLVEVGRRPTERRCAHGRKINVYKIKEMEAKK